MESERLAVATKPTDDLEAYEYFLRGREYLSQSNSEDDTRLAIQMYRRAVDLDSGFALAYAELSRAHSGMWWYGYDRSEGRLPRAREALDSAFAYSPELPEAHIALGYYYYHGFLDYPQALEAFAIAQGNRPNNPDLIDGIGFVQRRQGRMDDALANQLRAFEIDPRSAVTANNIAGTYAVMRNAEEALRYTRRSASLNPAWTDSYHWEALNIRLRLEGNTAEARRVLGRAKNFSIEDPNLDFILIWVEIFDQNYLAALDRLASLTSEAYDRGQLRYVPRAQFYADIYRYLGNDRLERVYSDSARIDVEARIAQHPEDHRLHSALGIAYVGLGRHGDAVQEGEAAVAIMPVEKDAFIPGPYRVEDLAAIYTVVGEHEKAIGRLEYLLSIPGELTAKFLRIDPRWDALRDNARFQALLARYEN